MTNHPIYDNSKGMLLVNLLIGMAIFAVMMVGIEAFISYQRKSLKNIEQVGAAQALTQSLTMGLSKSAECKIAIGLDTTPITIPKLSLPGQPTSTATTYSHNLAAITIPGQIKINVGDTYDGWILKKAEIIFSNPTTSSGLRYIAPLSLTLEKQNKLASLGSNTLVRKIPLAITVAEVDTTNLAVTDCLGSNDSNGPTACESLGGRWLSSTNNSNSAAMAARCPATFLTKERCVFDAAFFLNSDELADGVACDGGVNDAGERAESCNYLPPSSYNVRTFLCPGVSGARSGYRCYFDPGSSRWGIWYFSGGNPVKKKYDCDKGVRISTISSTAEQLIWSERLYLAKSATPPADDNATLMFSADEQVQLTETVNKCYYEPDSDKYVTCSNSLDVASGYLASGHSCVFVKNITLPNPNNSVSNRITRCQSTSTDGCPTGLTGYSGWIYTGTVRKVYQKNNTAYFTEARGIPCFRVELDTADAKVVPAGMTTVLNAVSGAPNSLPTNLKYTPEKIKQCLYSGQTTAGESKNSLLPCFNESADINSVAGAVDENYDYVGHNAAGTSNDVPSKLSKYTCWYVVNSPVKNYSTSYTGWIRFKSDLPNWGVFTMQADGGIKRTATAYQIDGDPCNQVLAAP